MQQNAWNYGEYRYAPAFSSGAPVTAHEVPQHLYTRSVSFQQDHYGRDHPNADTSSSSSSSSSSAADCSSRPPAHGQHHARAQTAGPASTLHLK